jgi:hypothetical protein
VVAGKKEGVLAVNAICLALLLTAGAAGEELYHDFRGKEVNENLFLCTGPDAATLMRAEPGGLRITLPTEPPVKATVGLVARFPIKGDFEITTRYEIVEAKPPTAGFGVGFAVYLKTSSPAEDATEFFHLVRRNGQEVYACSRLTTINGRRMGVPNIDVGDRPATEKAGQLRLVRRGAELVLSAAGLQDKQFRELYRFELGADDIASFRIGVNPGNAPNPVDVRLIDLRVRSDVPADELPMPAPKRSYLWLAVILAAALVVGVFLGWMRKRQTRSAVNENATRSE